MMAMMKLAEGGLKGFEWCWHRFLGLLPGGAGGAAMPPKTLDLPDVDEAKYIQDRAADQQRAADYILSSPERVVQAWAQASPEHRDTIPLTRLTDDQIDWLEVRLTDDQLKMLAAEKSETQDCRSSSRARRRYPWGAKRARQNPEIRTRFDGADCRISKGRNRTPAGLRSL